MTHYLEEINELADKICFLNKGTIIERGDLSEMYRKYDIADRDICKLYEEVIVDEQDT